jgi:hypothetical protein
MDMQIQSECTTGTPVLTNWSLLLAQNSEAMPWGSLGVEYYSVKFIWGDIIVIGGCAIYMYIQITVRTTAQTTDLNISMYTVCTVYQRVVRLVTGCS